MEFSFLRAATVAGSVLQMLTMQRSTFPVTCVTSEDEKKKFSLEPSGYRICQSTASVIVAWELARYIPWLWLPVVIDLMTSSKLGVRLGGSSSRVLSGSWN